MKKINLNEKAYNRLVNEISYGTVDNAYRRSMDIFSDAQSAFEEFYNALTDALYNVQYESGEYEQTSNPYLNKIKEHADAIYDIFNQKMNQRDKFFDATTNKVNHNKFWNSEEGQDNDIDDMDLTYLQKKYGK